MSEPLRFFHVADAHLDAPLAGVTSHSDELRTLAIDATLNAFDQMVLGAIDREVDFILLAGNTFREADGSLRARNCLLRGLETLDEAGVEVFVLPGSLDPETAWRAIPHLPNNVTLLTPSDPMDEDPSTPVAVMRDGRVVATITCGMRSQLSEANAGQSAPSTNGRVRNAPFRVGLLTDCHDNATDEETLAEHLSASGCPYLALPAIRQTSVERTIKTRTGIAHSPGPLQALAPNQTGPHGAAMIEVDENGEIHQHLLPFASVRRMRVEIDAQNFSSSGQLCGLMKARLAEETPADGEDAWLIQWIVESWNESLGDRRGSELQADLIDVLPKSHPANAELLLEHQIEFQFTRSPKAGDPHTSQLNEFYLEALETASADDASLREGVIRLVESHDNPNWSHRLVPLVDEMNPAGVRSRAKALGGEWFRRSAEEE